MRATFVISHLYDSILSDEHCTHATSIYLSIHLFIYSFIYPEITYPTNDTMFKQMLRFIMCISILWICCIFNDNIDTKAPNAEHHSTQFNVWFCFCFYLCQITQCYLALTVVRMWNVFLCKMLMVKIRVYLSTTAKHTFSKLFGKVIQILVKIAKSTIQTSITQIRNGSMVLCFLT